MPEPDRMFYHRLVPILKRLSDPEYQVAVWGKKHPNYIDDFSQAEEEIDEVYQFFGEAGELGEKSLSKKNLSLLRIIRDKITEYDISWRECKDSELLVKNPKWIEIQNLARELLNSLGDAL